jgi:lipopolysaccharide export LptBFGC system permease protein LptF
MLISFKRLLLSAAASLLTACRVLVFKLASFSVVLAFWLAPISQRQQSRYRNPIEGAGSVSLFESRLKGLKH